MRQDAGMSIAMTSARTPPLALPPPPHQDLDDVPGLVGEVFAQASAPLRSRLLEPLLKPLGLLALAAVCNGAFAPLALSRGQARGQVRLEDIASVQPSDVVTLARFAMQVSEQVVDGLARFLASTPALPHSEALQALMGALALHVQRLTLTPGNTFTDSLLDA
jgi:hypothetical protein